MEYLKMGIGHEDMPQLKSCEYPRQVRWIDFDAEEEDKSLLYGIQLGDKVICSCCGGIFSIDELNELARNMLCTNWVDVREDWISFTNEMDFGW